MQFVTMTDGSTRDLRLVLPEAGGTVAGTVTDYTGAPVAGAVVAVGKRGWGRLDTTPDGALRATVRTDADGRFCALGLPAGDHPVDVRATTLAPWTGSCRVEANLETAFDVTLGPAMSCVGVVVAAAGAPVANAKVEVGDWDALAHCLTRSGEDGSFRLDGLPPGDIEVTGRHKVAGDGRLAIHGKAGETVRCTLRLTPGVALRGRVLSAADEPIAEASVDARSSDPSWGRWTVTDAGGRFAINQCPEDENLTVSVTAFGFERVVIEDADPRRGRLRRPHDQGP